MSEWFSRMKTMMFFHEWMFIFQENGGIARDQLATSLATLQATLADRRSNLSQATEAEIGRRVEAVQTQLKSYQDILKGCSVVDLAQEMLKETDKACFVQAARPILGRWVYWVIIWVSDWPPCTCSWCQTHVYAQHTTLSQWYRCSYQGWLSCVEKEVHFRYTTSVNTFW